MKNVMRKSGLFFVVVVCIWFISGITNAGAESPTATFRQLTTSVDDSHHGDWSPDGGSVVFQRSFGENSYGNIYGIRWDGTGETLLTSGYRCDSKPQYSPDGKRIVFQRYMEPTGSETTGEKATIWVKDLGSGEEKKIVDYINSPGSAQLTSASVEGGAQWPFWSLDGMYIAFWYGGSGNKGLYVVKPDGTGMRQLYTDIGYKPHMFIKWRPKRTGLNNQILVSLKDGSGDRHIALVNVGSPNINWLTNGGTCQVDARWRPDGKRILYTDDANERSDIWLMNPDGSNKVRLTDSASNNDACYSHPSWSPDGRYIVYRSSEGFDDRGYKRIFVMTADGKKRRCIMNNGLLYGGDSSYLLSFNPQGTKILFQGEDDSDTSQLYVIDLNVNDDDRDGLLNWEEDLWRTSRSNPDTDGGGVSDGNEVAKGLNPLNPRDDWRY